MTLTTAKTERYHLLFIHTEWQKIIKLYFKAVKIIKDNTQNITYCLKETADKSNRWESNRTKITLLQYFGINNLLGSRLDFQTLWTFFFSAAAGTNTGSECSMSASLALSDICFDSDSACWRRRTLSDFTRLLSTSSSSNFLRFIERVELRRLWVNVSFAAIGVCITDSP